MTQVLLPPLMLYAACGLALSLLVHILSFFGIQFGGNALFFSLHVGIFPLWIPVVLIAKKMSGGAQRKDFWKAALSGCPPWMKYMTYGFFIYAFVNFAIFMVLVSAHPPVKGAAEPPAEVLHGFSGHWMAFYSAGLAILTTAYRRGLSNLQRECPFGHEIAGTTSSVRPAELRSLPRRSRIDGKFVLSGPSKAGHPVRGAAGLNRCFRQKPRSRTMMPGKQP